VHSRLRRALVALCVATVALQARVLHAQSLIGGVALDSASGRPLRCLRAYLLDSAGVATDSTLTRTGGLFQFLVMKSGLYRVRFELKNVVDVVSPPERLENANEALHTFRLPMVLTTELLAQLSSGEPRLGPLRPKGTWPTPEYPEVLKNSGRGGIVVLLIPVDTSGAIDHASVIPVVSSEPSLATSVMRALLRARFEPWHRDGMTCAIGIQPVRFVSTERREPSP
jgi:TonB family protein